MKARSISEAQLKLVKKILTTNFCYNLVILGITRKFPLAKVGRLFKGADRRETGSGREVLQRCLGCLGYQPGLDLGRNEADLISPIRAKELKRGSWGMTGKQTTLEDSLYLRFAMICHVTCEYSNTISI